MSGGIVMKIKDKVGFLLMKLLDFYWKICRREFLWSVRKMRKHEGVVYFDRIMERTKNEKK